MQHHEEKEAIRIGELISRQLSGGIDETEQAEIRDWLARAPENQRTYSALLDEQTRSLDLQHYQEIDAEKAFDRMSPRLVYPTRKSYRRLLPYAAAIVLLALGLGVYLYISDKGVKHYAPTLSTYPQDIDPGGNRAILTLADGRKIMLDDAANGELAEESGIRITKTEDGQIVYEVLRHAPQARASESRIADARQPAEPASGWRASAMRDPMRDPATYNTIETPKGGQYKIILPDSSVVWLNAASSLRYPTRFSGAERRVELTGEAFFQVKRKKVVETQHIASFIVATATQEVQVLGTQFNVNAYADEAAVKTTLVEGAVSVRVASTPDKSTNQPINQSTTLRPNQQSVLSGRSLAVVDVDVEEAVAWKQGTFIFNGTDLHGVLRQIGRWYDVDVDYADIPDRQITAIISRKVKLSAVLQSLEATSNIKLTLKERRIMAR